MATGLKIAADSAADSATGAATGGERAAEHGAAAPPPRHIAVVMDGNGRWAGRHGEARAVGHHRGLDKAREVVRHCVSRGVRYLTLFSFSSENWKRPETEVRWLIGILRTALATDVDEIHDQGVRLRVIGDTAPFDPELRRLIAEVEQRTANNDVMGLTVAANYGGHWDLAQACRGIAQRVAAGELEPAQVDEAVLEQSLSTATLPPPDLLIRTGGEKRLSNFLLWQIAYTELYFSDVYWPDFGAHELEQAIADYGRRQRRFGRTAEQVAAAPRRA